ncbi:collagen alpha-1(I) chain-like [Eublepharis macularius]|uniref:Collagen alpha-1(I) chain-like n=1 Tax=Eublepharis macularius TaxID=481883 RepID=A0AA97JQE8_EUBMA|nr:collagen alpha-1(I) chain-like [Eublepharis macularius]
MQNGTRLNLIKPEAETTLRAPGRATRGRPSSRAFASPPPPPRTGLSLPASEMGAAARGRPPGKRLQPPRQPESSSRAGAGAGAPLAAGPRAAPPPGPERPSALPCASAAAPPPRAPSPISPPPSPAARPFGREMLAGPRRAGGPGAAPRGAAPSPGRAPRNREGRRGARPGAGERADAVGPPGRAFVPRDPRRRHAPGGRTKGGRRPRASGGGTRCPPGPARPAHLSGAPRLASPPARRLQPGTAEGLRNASAAAVTSRRGSGAGRAWAERRAVPCRGGGRRGPQRRPGARRPGAGAGEAGLLFTRPRRSAGTARRGGERPPLRRAALGLPGRGSRPEAARVSCARPAQPRLASPGREARASHLAGQLWRGGGSGGIPAGALPSRSRASPWAFLDLQGSSRKKRGCPSPAQPSPARCLRSPGWGSLTAPLRGRRAAPGRPGGGLEPSPAPGQGSRPGRLFPAVKRGCGPGRRSAQAQTLSDPPAAPGAFRAQELASEGPGGARAGRGVDCLGTRRLHRARPFSVRSRPSGVCRPPPASPPRCLRGLVGVGRLAGVGGRAPPSPAGASPAVSPGALLWRAASRASPGARRGAPCFSSSRRRPREAGEEAAERPGPAAAVLRLPAPEAEPPSPGPASSGKRSEGRGAAAGRALLGYAGDARGAAMPSQTPPSAAHRRRPPPPPPGRQGDSPASAARAPRPPRRASSLPPVAANPPPAPRQRGARARRPAGRRRERCAGPGGARVGGWPGAHCLRGGLSGPPGAPGRLCSPQPWAVASGPRRRGRPAAWMGAEALAGRQARLTGPAGRSKPRGKSPLTAPSPEAARPRLLPESPAAPRGAWAGACALSHLLPALPRQGRVGRAGQSRAQRGS